MAEENRYFKGAVPSSINSMVYQVMVGYALDLIAKPTGNQCVLKLHKGDMQDHQCMNSYTEITHEEAVELVRSWEE